MSRPDEPLVVPVKIPPWAAPGDTLRATHVPTGQSGRFVVPPWAEPGQRIRVELPSVEECAEHELRIRRETAALPEAPIAEAIPVEPTDGGGGDTAGIELTMRIWAVGAAAAAADNGGRNPTPAAVVPAAAAARPPEPLYPPPAEPADEEEEEGEEEEVPTALACS